MQKRILRLEDEFWRIRTDKGELADAERDALRAYLDQKGFKTTIIDDNLAIAGELTWQEVVEPIEGFYEARWMCIRSERGDHLPNARAGYSRGVTLKASSSVQLARCVRSSGVTRGERRGPSIDF
jgi:hypothetical protein